MSNFFGDIFNPLHPEKPCYVNIGNMHRMMHIISGRNLSTNVDITDICISLGVNAKKYEKLKKMCEEYPTHCENGLTDQLETKMSDLCGPLSVLIKYFYPIIEQLDKLVDETFMPIDQFEHRKNESTYNDEK